MEKVLSFETILYDLPYELVNLLENFHKRIVAEANQFHIARDNGSYRITYTNFLHLFIYKDHIDVKLKYDTKSLREFYKNSENEQAKKILFESLISCKECGEGGVLYCTNFTTPRTIQYNGKSKKYCTLFWRQWIKFPLNNDTYNWVCSLAEMTFNHTNAFESLSPEFTKSYTENKVTYEIKQQPEIHMLAFVHHCTMYSISTEEFIARCFAKTDKGRRIDQLIDLSKAGDDARFIGAMRDFDHPSQYTFYLGVQCSKDKIPDVLPQNVKVIRLQAGEYAVYNSSAQDYNSIWKEFDKIYKSGVGYDIERIPYEYYDQDGNFCNVCIPIAPNINKDDVRRIVPILTQDITVAGFKIYCENDYPDFRNPLSKKYNDIIRRLFPNAPRYIDTNHDSIAGEPAFERICVEYDEKYDTLPAYDGLQVATIRGGIWNRVCYPYPAPEEYYWDINYEVPEHRVPGHSLYREMLKIDYRGRAGVEIWIGNQLRDDFIFEIVELPDIILACKKIVIPDRIVTTEEAYEYCDLDCNVEKGSYYVCMDVLNNPLASGEYTVSTVIKGFRVKDASDVPDGMEVYVIPAGKYVKRYHKPPLKNGIPGTPSYEVQGGVDPIKEQFGLEADKSKLIVDHLIGKGREYITYFPVLDK